MGNDDGQGTYTGSLHSHTVQHPSSCIQIARLPGGTSKALRLPNFVASRLALEKSTPPRYPAYFGRDGGGPAQLANPHKGKSKACTHRKPDLRTFPQSPSSDRPSGAQGCPYRGIDRASRCLQRSTTVEAKDIGLLSRPSGRPCSVDSRLHWQSQVISCWIPGGHASFKSSSLQERRCSHG